MSNHTQLKRVGRAATALAVVFGFAAIPAAAQAAPVNLATAAPFVVLGGQSVTNTGPSVLNGQLGVAPGTSLTGFGAPAVVNGATHNNDGVANQAQADLTTAYGVAAGQPVAPANDLTGTNLGNRTLPAGAYRYTSSAQLTGALTLDAQGDPNAQFVFEIGTQLTTASASSVALINGASPCNVFWQMDTAVLGSTTAFQGNVLALTSISLNNGASVIGRMLARNGSVSLINNVLDNSRCVAGSSSTPAPGGTPSGSAPTSVDVPPTGTTPSVNPTGPGATRRGTATLLRAPHEVCTAGFRATVRGRLIKSVVFSLDGSRISSRTRSPFEVSVVASPGQHTVRARVTFKDATRAKTLKLGYRACAAAVLRPRRGPARFTG